MRFCFINKLSGDADAAGPRTILWVEDLDAKEPDKKQSSVMESNLGCVTYIL